MADIARSDINGDDDERLAEAKEVTKDDLMKITKEDVRAALYPDAENIPEKEEE